MLDVKKQKKIFGARLMAHNKPFIYVVVGMTGAFVCGLSGCLFGPLIVAQMFAMFNPDPVESRNQVNFFCGIMLSVAGISFLFRFLTKFCFGMIG